MSFWWKFSSLAAPVILTTSGAASDENFVKMSIIPFQLCMNDFCVLFWNIKVIDVINEPDHYHRNIFSNTRKGGLVIHILFCTVLYINQTFKYQSNNNKSISHKILTRANMCILCMYIYEHVYIFVRHVFLLGMWIALLFILIYMIIY